MKKLILTLALTGLLLMQPINASAQQYGQGPETLGAQEPEVHETVETAIGDDIKVLASVFIVASSALLFLSKKIQANSVVVTK